MSPLFSMLSAFLMGGLFVIALGIILDRTRLNHKGTPGGWIWWTTTAPSQAVYPDAPLPDGCAWAGSWQPAGITFAEGKTLLHYARPFNRVAS